MDMDACSGGTKSNESTPINLHHNKPTQGVAAAFGLDMDDVLNLEPEVRRCLVYFMIYIYIYIERE